jgi:hypothetical protein
MTSPPPHRATQLSPETVRRLMREHRKTIRGLAEQMNVPMARVREVRERGVTGAAYCQDWIEALTAPSEGEPRHATASLP